MFCDIFSFGYNLIDKFLYLRERLIMSIHNYMI